MLVLTIRGLELEFVESGELFTWLGPALRGCVAEELKDQVCRHPPAERWRRWKRCAGCQHVADCTYAVLFDPAPPPNAKLLSGEGVTPPLVLAPQLLCAGGPGDGRRGTPRAQPGSRVGDRARAARSHPTVSVSPGMRLAVASILLGPAVDLAHLVLDVLARAVRTRGLGRTPHRVRAVCADAAAATRQTVRLGRRDLTDPVASDAGIVPRATVELTAPLAIKQYGKACVRPHFNNVFAYSHRQVDRLLRTYDVPLEYDAKALEALAGAVPRVAEAWRPFIQPIQSGKGEDHHKFRGVVGWASFAEVPAALLPWLVWGGRLHVGDRRAHGAGGWRVVLD